MASERLGTLAKNQRRRFLQELEEHRIIKYGKNLLYIVPFFARPVEHRGGSTFSPLGQIASIRGESLYLEHTEDSDNEKHHNHISKTYNRALSRSN